MPSRATLNDALRRGEELANTPTLSASYRVVSASAVLEPLVPLAGRSTTSAAHGSAKPPTHSMPPMPTPATLNGAVATGKAHSDDQKRSDDVDETECGHLFVLHCAAFGLAADAILIPTREGSEAGVVIGKVRELTTDEIEGAGFKGVTAVYEGHISTEGYKTEAEAIEGTMKVVASFIASAAPGLKGSTSGFRRAKPLIALPLPGVGLVDVNNVIKDMEQIVRPLITALYAAVRDYEVDIAVCTIDEEAYKVLQVLRSECCPYEGGPFWMLSSELMNEVRRLKEQALAGRLGILYGAGLSFPSGLPSWGGLLEMLAKRAGFDESEQKALLELGFLDQPTVIEDKMGSTAAFKQAVADSVKDGRYTPAHAIMGSMRLPAVTTNYDTLYENAVASATTDVANRVQRLPWDASVVAKLPRDVRRVVKLHGCVRDPPSIVLTREDYMRYEDDKRALRGLLHQNLLEREFLVVGFSMTDDNVHVIIDQVKKTLEAHQVDYKKFMMGTVVTLVENAMFRKLWSDDFHVVSCGKSWGNKPAWIHDIFLDALASSIVVPHAKASFVLNWAYDDLLTPAQRKIRDALAPLQALSKDAEVTSSEAWGLVDQLLTAFGNSNHDTHAARHSYGAPVSSWR